jgi:hypothetical protein
MLFPSGATARSFFFLRSFFFPDARRANLRRRHAFAYGKNHSAARGERPRRKYATNLSQRIAKCSSLDLLEAAATQNEYRRLAHCGG